MPSTPSDRLKLEVPLTTENANGPALGALLVAGLEDSVGMVKLESKVPSAGVLAFDTINDQFHHLLVRGVARVASGLGLNLRARINGDTGANYMQTVRQNNGTDQTLSSSNSSNALDIGFVRSDANYLVPFDLRIFNYDLAAYKEIMAESTYPGGTIGTTAPSKYDVVGYHKSAAALTAISIYCSGADLASPSRADLYGIL